MTAATPSNFRPNAPHDRLILALDVPTITEAEDIIAETRGTVGSTRSAISWRFRAACRSPNGSSPRARKCFSI